jgi:peptidoglycan hydrolase CwlO-like protein
MFLLSSESFWQAYKRMAYMKQYAAYRKQQGEQIAAKTKALQQYTTDLVAQRKDKKQLIEENRKAQKELDSIRKRQNTLVLGAEKTRKKLHCTNQEKAKTTRGY